MTQPERSRADISRANSLLSTGPRTVEATRFNARKHNLTGQTIVLTDADREIFAANCQRLMDDFNPQGEFETRLVQSIADAQWQLDRARAIETNILAEAALKHTGGAADLASEAIGLSRAFLENAKQLDLLSRYGNRHLRQVLQLHDRLAKVQKERKKAEQLANLEQQKKLREEFAAHQRATETPQPKQIKTPTPQPGFVSQTPTNPNPPAPPPPSERLENSERTAA